MNAPAMTPDLKKYLPYLDGLDLPDARKVELIHTVGQIMQSFVDHAFGQHPAQLCLAERGAVDSRPAKNPVNSCKLSLTEEFLPRAQDVAEEGI